MQKQWVPEDHAHLARRGGCTKIKALQKVEDLDPMRLRVTSETSVSQLPYAIVRACATHGMRVDLIHAKKATLHRKMCDRTNDQGWNDPTARVRNIARRGRTIRSHNGSRSLQSDAAHARHLLYSPVRSHSWR